MATIFGVRFAAMAANQPDSTLRFRAATADAMQRIRERISALPIMATVAGHIGDIADGEDLQEMGLDELCTVLHRLLASDEDRISSDGMPFEYVVERWEPGSPVLAITTRIEGPRNAGSISYASCVQRLAPDRFCLLDSHSE